MRFVRSLFALGTLCLGLAALPSQASAQSPVGPILEGTRCGVIDLSQGTTPTVFTSASLKDMTSVADTAAALAASLRYTSCQVRNTHASQVLYFTAGSVGASAATTNRLAIPAGAAQYIPLYGLYPTSVSLDASGAATTGQLYCCFVTR